MPQTPAFGIPASGDVLEPEIGEQGHVAPVVGAQPAIVWLRYAALAAMAAYGIFRLARPEWWDLLDDVNLAVHEAGHVVFSPLGETVTILGGSLFQVIVPAAFVIYFLRSRQPFAGAITLGWVAQSMVNVARYIADARARDLPLLGGDDSIHDWEFLLGEWGLLERDTAIAHSVELAAAILLIAAVALGVLMVHSGKERTT
jgi:hypothetical protein